MKITKEQGDEFFYKVGAEAGVNSIATVKNIYRSIVTVLFRDARNLGLAVLPDLGEFKIKKLGDRPGINVNTGERMVKEGKKVLRFTPCRKIVLYLNEGKQIKK